MTKIAFTVEGFRLEICEELTGYSFKVISAKGKELAYLLRNTEEEATIEGLNYLKSVFQNMIASVNFKLKEFK